MIVYRLHCYRFVYVNNITTHVDSTFDIVLLFARSRVDNLTNIEHLTRHNVWQPNNCVRRQYGLRIWL